MKGRIILILILSAGLVPFVHSQIQNVNIGGSFSGTFMLSGSGEADYQVAGSPYLSETWMFGSLEMQGEAASAAKKNKKAKAQLYKYQVKIARIEKLIEQLSDPGNEATGLALTMAGRDSVGETGEYDLRISNSDLAGFSSVTEDLEKNLLHYLKKLKGEYEAEINSFFKLNGLFRYNLYAQEFEMIYNSDTFSITSPFNVKSISISNMKFLYGLYVKRGGSQPLLGSAYFQLLSEGECKLLRRHDVKIKSGGGPVTYSWAGGGDTFVHYEQLYYQKEEGGEVIPLKKSKSSIRSLFGDHSEEIEKFIRSEKIRIKDNAGLIRVFNYYNSLNS